MQTLAEDQHWNRARFDYVGIVVDSVFGLPRKRLPMLFAGRWSPLSKVQLQLRQFIVTGSHELEIEPMGK